MCGSMFCEDLIRPYRNKQLLIADQQTVKRLKSLTDDYDALLKLLREDPNLVKRLASGTLGTDPPDQNTVYPTATPEQLNAARKALTEDSDRQISEPTLPHWLTRCSKGPQRIILFVAGAALILVSFIWFGSAKPPRQKQEQSAE